MTGWITNKRNYMPPVRQTALCEAFGVGEIIEEVEAIVSPVVVGLPVLGMRSHGVFNDKDVRPIAVDTAPAECISLASA